MRPSSWCSIPAMIFIKVDLPAPFGPASEKRSPACSVKFSPPKRRRPLYEMPRFSAASMGGVEDASDDARGKGRLAVFPHQSPEETALHSPQRGKGAKSAEYTVFF